MIAIFPLRSHISHGNLSQIENIGLNDSDRISGITKDRKYQTSEYLHKNFRASLFPTNLNVFFYLN
jgi:hypothetical protein